MKRTLNHIADQYRKETGGNVAMMFAICLFFMIGGLALAVDITNGRIAQQRLQDTTDAIALMAAKDKTLDTDQKIEEAAQALYDLTYPGDKGQRIVIKEVVRDGDKVTIVVQNNIDTYFTGVFKTSNLDVGVTSSAVFADKAMDVALVLDTTYSMSGTKISSLKSAANGLVDMFDDLDNDNLRVSVVPFSQYVNVGLSRRHAKWLDVPNDSSTQGAEVCKMKRDVIARTNCRRIQRTCTNDGVQYDCSYTKCDKQYGQPYRHCYTPTNTATWRGCVGSRENGYDERPAYDSRKVPGLMNVKCGAELQTLSKNMTTAKATIASLKPQGETYIPAGVLWGWRTLDETVPLSSKVGNPKKKREKVMIVMTDGDNTLSKNGIRHTGQDTAAANAKTATLCARAKADEVTIYTIAYEVDSANTKRMLNRCATDGSKFYDARNASELNKAFESIGDALNELRIAA